MSLQFILGPTASGKTNQICKAAVDKAVSSPSENIIVIVPEQATLQMQKRIVSMHPEGCALNIDIVSFNRLAHKVFSDLGIDDKNVIDDLGKVLILRQVLGDMADSSDLGPYKNKIHYTGFVSGIKSQLSEFAQYGIDDNELFLMEESVSEDEILKGKIRLLREVRRHFADAIKDRFKTSEELFDMFSKVIRKSSRIIGSHVFLDGFTGFTPIQYKLLREILRHAANVTVSLTLPSDEIRRSVEDYKEYDLFSLPAREYFTLREIAHDLGVEVSEIAGGMSSLGALSSSRMFENLPSEVKILKAADLEDESGKVAQRISDLVQKKGCRYRDIAVVCSDLEGYFHYIRDVFSAAKIPCFIDYKSGLSMNPLSRFILSALGICLSYLRQGEEFFSMLKTGITDLGADEACLLENYCLEFGINSLSKMGKEFKANRALRGGKSKDEGNAWDLDRINEIRKRAAGPVISFYDSITRAKSPSEYCTAIIKLLEECHAEEKIAQLSEDINDISLSGEYARIYSLTEELLEKIGSLLTANTVSLQEFFDILKIGLDSMKVGIIPPSLDMVTVGDVVRSRLDKPKVLFIMGANEGKLPKSAEGGGIFTDRERALLKSKNFEIAPTMLEDLYSQQFYIYLMLNKAKDALYLSFAASDISGESMDPAYIVTSLEDEIQNLNEHFESKDADFTKDIYWESDALRTLAKGVREYSASKIADDLLKELLKYFAGSCPDRLYQILDGAAFTNLESPLDLKLAERLYGEKLRLSVSRIETYNMCAFMHFLNYGLKLEERREYKPDYKAIGTIIHGAIELYSKALEEKGLSFRTISDEDSDTLITDALDSEIASFGTDVFNSTGRNAYIKENMLKVLKKTTRVLRSQILKGFFEPAKFEHYFRMRISDNLELSGIIDRIDIYDAEDVFLRVIDYKSGFKKFDVTDVYTGLSLQLPTYLEAALKEAADKGVKAKPAGLYYYHVADGYTKKDEAKTKFRMDGLTNKDGDVLLATDSSITDGGESEVVKLKYEKGAYKGNTDTISCAQLENMIDFTHEKILEAGDKILKGSVDINPYNKKGRSPCGYCPYAAVCKFEPVTFDVDFRDLGDIDTKAARSAVYDGIKEDGD